jgi:hypothetical protein
VTHLKIIVRAGLLDGLRWARQNLYSLLILSPLVLGMTYFGVGRMVGDAEWSPSARQVAALAVAAAACLLALSMSRAGMEIYHLRRPESLFDTLPVSADVHLLAALLRRAASTSAAGLAALVLRGLAGGALPEASLFVALSLFVCVMAAGEVLAALEWIHWGHRRERGHAAAAVLAFAACAGAGGLLLAQVLRPGEATFVSRGALYASALLLTGALSGLAFVLHRRWRAADVEFAKRLGTRDRWGSFVERVAARAGGTSPVAAQLARDLQLTLRGFSSAVYVAGALAALTVLALVAALTGGLIADAGSGQDGWLAATWLPRVLALKLACVVACVSLASVVPALVSHQLPHLWLERSIGVKGADAWRAKLYFTRVVALPAPFAAWAAGVACGAVPAFYALPLLAECLWLWWLVSTLVGALAFEMPEQPGLSLILMSCVALGAGGFVAFLWPMGLAIYAMGMQQLCMRGVMSAHRHLTGEGA